MDVPLCGDATGRTRPTSLSFWPGKRFFARTAAVAVYACGVGACVAFGLFARAAWQHNQRVAARSADVLAEYGEIHTSVQGISFMASPVAGKVEIGQDLDLGWDGSLPMAKEYCRHLKDKFNVTGGCCHQLQRTAYELRYVLLTDIIMAFVLGVVTVIGAFAAGTFVKPKPPKYWKNRSIMNLFYDDYYEEVDVTKELQDTMQELLDITTSPKKMGKGREGSFITHKGFEVTKVTRIENGNVYTKNKNLKYEIKPVEETLKLMKARADIMVEGSPEHSKMKTQIEGTEKAFETMRDIHSCLVSKPNIAKLCKNMNLNEERNERLLFHGCPAERSRDADGNLKFPNEEECPLQAVKKCGFDERLGNFGGMLGSGSYFADMACKSDQYAGKNSADPSTTVGEEACMFIARVTLGCQYRTDQSLEGLRRPPDIEGNFDPSLQWDDNVGDSRIGKPWKDKGLSFQLSQNLRYTSVMSDLVVDGEHKYYREFVVYDKKAYPEFCVYYKRVAEKLRSGSHDTDVIMPLDTLKMEGTTVSQFD